MRELHWPTIATGAGIALALAVPAALIAQLLDARDSVDDNSSWLLLLVGVIMAGMAIGGYQAAVRRMDAPLTHAGVAALAAYVVVQGIGVARRLAIGEEIAWLSIPFFLLLSASCGVCGGLVADIRARRPSR
jgi:small-conductance mechanosensitive channel